MKVLVVIQARVGSTRLPAKVLLPLAGAPLLQRLIERVRAAQTPFELVVATTKGPEDEPIRRLCEKLRVACFGGHPTDLLDRHYQAACAAGAEVVVKIPSDCPLIDPAVIDRVLATYLSDPGRYDFVSNLHPASYPDGNDVEVLPVPVLATAWREATQDFEREHTTPFVWDHPERFRVGNVVWEGGFDLSMSHRFTVDYPDDYAFVAGVYQALWRPQRRPFSLDEILGLLDADPHLYRRNARHAGVNWYRHHLVALRTVGAGQTRPERGTVSPARQSLPDVRRLREQARRLAGPDGGPTGW